MDANTVNNAILVTRDNAKRVSKGLPILARATINALLHLKYGALTVVWPNGDITRIEGELPGADACIELKSLDLAKRVLSSGDVGVAESFMDGEWQSPDVTAVLLLFCQNTHLGIARQRAFFTRLVLAYFRWRNTNTKRGSKRNIAAHYDLGNDFYSRWLDPSMTYSSAIFEEKTMSLEEAQRAKYASLARLLDLKPSHNVLEIGCGWGGFAEYAASEIKCRVTGLTISREQLDYAKKRVFEAGLNDKVDIVFRDYREETGVYDRIASIEMFEAVGEKYWPTYFDTVRDRLNPGGAAGLQIITIKDDLFEAYRSTTDFIQRYIFPGGMLPTPTILGKLTSARGLTLAEERIFGHDYADTLVAWRDRFHRAWPEIVPFGFDERFKRMWEFYMHYCEAGFRSENIDVRQMIFARS
ncbi:MAG: class I SAM-dependent methyltransferase [Rhizobiales bacterium]|nr:class I SAM-dependent methyltransferase [Hyphomicrobiales bacterium]